MIRSTISAYPIMGDMGQSVEHSNQLDNTDRQHIQGLDLVTSRGEIKEKILGNFLKICKTFINIIYYITHIIILYSKIWGRVGTNGDLVLEVYILAQRNDIKTSITVKTSKKRNILVICPAARYKNIISYYIM